MTRGDRDKAYDSIVALVGEKQAKAVFSDLIRESARNKVNKDFDFPLKNRGCISFLESIRFILGVIYKQEVTSSVNGLPIGDGCSTIYRMHSCLCLFHRYVHEC